MRFFLFFFFLEFHCKPVNQLAVDYWTPGNILASCSNDGTATIWNIGESGKSGQGSICELDAPFYKDPAVECLEFGHHASKNHLFLGIYNRAVEHTGYVSGLYIYKKIVLIFTIRYKRLIQLLVDP